MAGLVPAIHVFGRHVLKDVYARDERGHDVQVMRASRRSGPGGVLEFNASFMASKPLASNICTPHLIVFSFDTGSSMKIEPSGWATIESAPRNGCRVTVWGKQPFDGPDILPYAAMAVFHAAKGWIVTDPNDGMEFQFNPTHWLPTEAITA
jgi:hypothetical protein